MQYRLRAVNNELMTKSLETTAVSAMSTGLMLSTVPQNGTEAVSQPVDIAETGRSLERLGHQLVVHGPQPILHAAAGVADGSSAAAHDQALTDAQSLFNRLPKLAMSTRNWSEFRRPAMLLKILRDAQSS